MSIAQIIQSGVVVNVITVDPAAVVAPGGGAITWSGNEFPAPPGAIFMMQPGAGIGWTLVGGVLVTPAPGAPVVPVMTAPQLAAYAQQKLAAISNGGITVNVAASGAPIDVAVDSSASGRADMLGLQAQIAGGATSIVWRQTGGALTLTPAQLATVATALAAFVEASFAAWQAASDGILASPATITTTAQIDALAWPANN